MDRQKQKIPEFTVQLAFHIVIGVGSGCFLFWDKPLNAGVIGIISMTIVYPLLWLIARARGKDYFFEIDTVIHGAVFGAILLLAYGLPDFVSGKFVFNLPVDALLLLSLGILAGGIGGAIGQRLTKKKLNN